MLDYAKFSLGLFHCVNVAKLILVLTLVLIA